MNLDFLIFNAHGIYTAVSFLFFLGVVVWTYGLRRKSDYEAAANLPFADEPTTQQGENRHG